MHVLVYTTDVYTVAWYYICVLYTILPNHVYVFRIPEGPGWFRIRSGSQSTRARRAGPGLPELEPATSDSESRARPACHFEPAAVPGARAGAAALQPQAAPSQARGSHRDSHRGTVHWPGQPHCQPEYRTGP